MLRETEGDLRKVRENVFFAVNDVMKGCVGIIQEMLREDYDFAFQAVEYTKNSFAQMDTVLKRLKKEISEDDLK